MFMQPKQLRGRKPIIQLRAGRMEKEGNLVKPDTKKGVFTLVNDTSGMVEILWTSMSDPNDTTSTMVFPGSATFDRVTKCTSGRVYVLDFEGSRQMFWWLQEPNEDRDEEFVKCVKKHIGDKKGASTDAKDSGSSGTSSSAPAQPGLDISTLQNILSGLGTSSPTGGAASGATGSSAATTGTSSGGGAASSGQALFGGPANDVDLQDLLASQEVLDALNEDPAFYMTQVHEHLPEGTDPAANVVEQLRNPQVSGTAAMLQAALTQADGYREITSAFGLTGGSGIGASNFISQVEAEAKKKKDEEAKKKEAEKKE